MTKDKLEKEAEEYLKKKNYTSGYIGYFASGYCNQAYIDSAEPREKRIEELEKENALLKGRNEGFEKQILGLLYKYESVYKRFPDLKDAMNEAEKVLKENADQKNQLTKAKEILSKLLEEEKNNMYWEMNGTDKSSYYKLREKAEQFIKDMEK